ncbi:hypothetical protein XELAEV_18017192mg [Xenopus laevis]|uniref:Septin-type G domain-containing protein n=1 Tax=Xenopus laevis TaxID=8355 RepID=A0A974HSM4_XENLA|nr:hypothetical protein XELAEV_18017192mg [Xenopus laevis]
MSFVDTYKYRVCAYNYEQLYGRTIRLRCAMGSSGIKIKPVRSTKRPIFAGLKMSALATHDPKIVYESSIRTLGSVCLWPPLQITIKITFFMVMPCVIVSMSGMCYIKTTQDLGLVLNEEKRSLAMSGHVGFDSLPDQLVSKSVTQGFCFNILCVGETGIGKSTLMNTLFNTTFETEEASHYENGVCLRPRTYDLQESNVHLKLTIVDTVGFGDQINKDDRSVVDYIDTQFENYLQEELKIRRSLFNFHDSRIHVCLYFITPTGHSLKSLDLVTMKKLDSKVNIIPIIAKADTISKSELHKFKIKIMSELVSNGVQIYQFPTDDDAVAEINSVMNAHLPFAVVGSTEEVKVGNKLVRARQYPWGVVQVENESHCDFVKLREMLIRVNMEDLREQTHTRHYELYRRCKLEEMGFKDNDPDTQPFRYLLVMSRCRKMNPRRRKSKMPKCKAGHRRKDLYDFRTSPRPKEKMEKAEDDMVLLQKYSGQMQFPARGLSLQETYEAKRKEFLSELQRKEEEMRQMFVNKVKETEAELKERERELQEKFMQLKRIHQEESKKVEDKRRDLEEEMNSFNRRKAAMEALQSQSFQATSQQPLKKDKDRKNPDFDSSTRSPDFDSSTLSPVFDSSTLSPDFDSSTLSPDFDSSTLSPDFDSSTLSPDFDSSTLSPDFDSSTLSPDFDSSTLSPDFNNSTRSPCSVIAGNQSTVSFSSTKVMIAKANVESLNCNNWWNTVQCCSCLVKTGPWQEGFI